MARPQRISCGGLVFHVFNRSAKRLPLFRTASDYSAFERVIEEANERHPIRLLSYAVMPNHWHMVLWPLQDGDLSRHLQWMTTAHARRWRTAHGTSGEGAVYQGRFKAIPVGCDEHFLTVCRYVERNPVRSGLASAVSDWPWSSAGRRRRSAGPDLAEWPVARPVDWEQWVGSPEPPMDLGGVRRAVRLDLPYGPEPWCKETANRLGWDSRLRGRGRRPSSRAPIEQRERL